MDGRGPLLYSLYDTGSQEGKQMRRIGIEQGRKTLPELASDALAGKATVLTRHGRPVAAIVPLSDLAGRRPVRLLSLRGSGKGLWGASPAATIDALRREWGP
jgi:antitoxin (DNA-binding transcriptional repressor) of toxin-antitoxin stability system